MPVYQMPVRITDARAGTCINSWHIRTVGSGGGATSDVQLAANAIRDFYNSLAGYYPTGTPIKADFAVDVESKADVPITWAALAGIGTGNVAPPHLAVCISWKTSARARRARGRTFLGPLVSAVLDTDGTVLTGALTNIGNAAQALVNASLVDNGWGVAIWGQQDAAAPKFQGDRSLLPHVARDIQGYAIQDKFAVMRSRRPR